MNLQKYNKIYYYYLLKKFNQINNSINATFFLQIWILFKPIKTIFSFNFKKLKYSWKKQVLFKKINIFIYSNQNFYLNKPKFWFINIFKVLKYYIYYTYYINKFNVNLLFFFNLLSIFLKKKLNKKYLYLI